MIDDPRTLVQRAQLTELCYLHGPVVVQYYAICLTKLRENSPFHEPEQIDITALILDSFNPDALGDYVIRGMGGNSKAGFPST